jgi:hypothetical protein
MPKRKWTILEPGSLRLPDQTPPRIDRETPRHTVPYVPPRCPACGNPRPKTNGSTKNEGAGRVRYHVCGDCGCCFESVEVHRLN